VDTLRPAKAGSTGLSGSDAVWTVAAMISVMFMGSTLLTPLYVIYQQTFGFSKITLTLIYAVYVVGNLTALLGFGRLSDQIGCRRAALPAVATAVVSTALYVFADTTAWLFVARALSGFAIGVASGTGTAWLAELHREKDKARATLFASVANLVGIGLGPIAAGLLAEYAPWPLRLPYVVYVILLLAIGWLLSRTEETVNRKAEELSLRPRLGIPREIRAPFIAPAVTAFAMFGFMGFYAALLPSLLIQSLHQANHAIGGAIVSELFLVAAAATVASAGLPSRSAMLWGLVLLLPSLGLVVLAQTLGSMVVLLIGTTVGGIAAAFGFRGSLLVVNRIAPGDRRAEVVSCYLVACYIGNSIPVIGVGVLSTYWSPTAADAAFAATVAAFAVAALIVGIRFIPRS
jgi:hypothetical protein